jgi:hypothetical protein
MLNRIHTGSLLLAVLTLFTWATTLAQSTTATLSGTVVDANGAVIAGANITISNTATGFERKAVTSDEGSFAIPLLPPSNYTLTVNRDGFAPAEIQNVILNVNDSRSLLITLKVGQVGAAVEVTSEAPLIDDSPAVGTTVDRTFVANLPLNGRSFQSLITLTPGVVITKTTPDNTGQFSVNGQRQDANYFTVDGVSANVGTTVVFALSQNAGGSLPALSATGGTNNLVSVDALEEFKILTSTYAPEFGRTPGGQVQIVTRSGGKDFHGNLFDYVRNEALDANDWFANRSGLKKPPMRQHDFGGTFSGPIVLPLFGEGKAPFYRSKNTFFFFSYEGLRLRLPQTTTTQVPSLCLRGRETCPAGLAPAPAAVQPFVNAFPLPTGPTLSNSMALLVASYANPSSLDATSLRLDHRVNDRVSFFGRYNNSPSKNTTRSTTGLANNTTVNIDTETLTAGVIAAFTDRLSNEFRANWSRVTGSGFVRGDDFLGAQPLPVTGFFPNFGTSETGISTYVLAVGLGGGVNLSLGKQIQNTQRQLNFVDNVHYLVGGHQFKFGVDFRRMAPIYSPADYSLRQTFNTIAALNAATVSSVEITAFAGARPSFINFSAYGQDTWKVSQRSTITYGLRWELNPPPTEASGNLPRTVVGIDTPATMSLAPQGTKLWNTAYGSFAPRFGITHLLSNRAGRETVLRGGIGTFFDLGNAQAVSGFITWPNQVTRTIANAPYPLSLANSTPAAFTSTLPATSAIYAFVPDLKLPRSYQWNLSIEQSLGTNQTISASYVGAIGRELLQVDDLRPPVVSTTLTSSVIRITRNTGSSDYHAMQLQFQRRLSQGLQALASYTWSKSIDTSSTDLVDLARARGASNFDVRHSFSGAATYNIPSPSRNDVVMAILGGWSVDSIIRAQSAIPVNLIARAGNLNLDGTSINVRPDLVAGVPIYLFDPIYAGGKRFNPAAFALPPTGPTPTFLPLRQGTLGRNALRGFPLYQVDMSLRRVFSITEKLNMLLRADVFNIFNHPNFADPNATLCTTVNATGCVANASFGLSQTMLGRSLGNSNIQLNPLYQVGGPRSVQLSLKLSF